MFGYILPEKPELKIKEYELFKAYYCGVCKSIAARFGQVPRSVLNYDCTFLAILLSSLDGTKPLTAKERCIVHPLKKRVFIKQNEALNYAADMNILLAYYNLEDNWKDDRSLISAAGRFALTSCYKKLKEKYYDKCKIIEKLLNELSELEKGKCSSMDKAAEPFAKLMEEITAHKTLCVEEKNESALRWIGYNIGKWIYIIDAFDDIEKDIKKGAFNPLVLQFDYNGEAIEGFKKRITSKVEFNLTYCLAQISKTGELLDIRNNKGLIDNIIYMGMLRKTENILMIGSCAKK